MTDDDFAAYVRGLRFTAEVAHDANGHPYTVIRQVTIPAGSLAGRTCDIALARCQSVPTSSQRPSTPGQRWCRWT